MSVDVLRGTRVALRMWRDEDLVPFAALNADPRVMEHFPAPLARDESDALAGRCRAGLATQPFGLWALEILATNGFAGFVGLSSPRFEAAFTPCVEIGWRLAHEHWGKGYVTEAARLALRHGFETCGLREIVSFTVTANRRSRAVMERLGMRQDGEFEHPGLPEGHPLRRHVLYRLDAADYRSGAAAWP